jgi:hypothetical protein
MLANLVARPKRHRAVIAFPNDDRLLILRVRIPLDDAANDRSKFAYVFVITYFIARPERHRAVIAFPEPYPYLLSLLLLSLLMVLLNRCILLLVESLVVPLHVESFVLLLLLLLLLFCCWKARACCCCRCWNVRKGIAADRGLSPAL